MWVEYRFNICFKILSSTSLVFRRTAESGTDNSKENFTLLHNYYNKLIHSGENHEKLHYLWKSRTLKAAFS